MTSSDAKRLSSGGLTASLSRRNLVGSAVALAAASRLAPTIAQEGASLAPTGLTAQSVYSFDATSDVLLYSQNPDERLAIGSLVKIVTALIVMETVSDLSTEVLIDESDTVDITVYSNMQLVAGDTLTVSLLLYGLLIPSGNDGARALARYAGSQISGNDDPDTARSAFVDRMNAFAQEQGLVNSQFLNADGIDARDTFSTAREIAALFSLLMDNERLREIVSLPTYRGTSSGPEARVYEDDTTNQRLGQNGIIGGKTGTTEEAGACVAFAREDASGNTVITAILGSTAEYNDSSELVTDERWNDADTLLGAMDEQLTWIEPPDDDALPGLGDEMSVWQVETREQAPVPMRVGDDQTMFQLVLGAPVAAGEAAGSVDLFYGEIQLGSFPVYQAG
ncbi:MAG: hypothetical protein WKF81_11280 [Thermomicrobiales bacterium]